MYVTPEMLREKHACENQVEMVQSEWGSGVVVNAESLKRARELGLDINWFAKNFLSVTALKAYQETKAAALKAYQEAKAAALKAHEEATAPALLVGLGIETN